MRPYSTRAFCALLLIAGLGACGGAASSGENRLTEANNILKTLPEPKRIEADLKALSENPKNNSVGENVNAACQMYSRLFRLIETGRPASDYIGLMDHARPRPSRYDASSNQFQIGIQSLTHQGTDPSIFTITVDSKGIITDAKLVIWKH